MIESREDIQRQAKDIAREAIGPEELRKYEHVEEFLLVVDNDIERAP